MARMVLAFALCSAVLAGTAAAQNGNTETVAPQSTPAEVTAPPATPVIPLVPPGPHDAPVAQAPAPAPEEKPVAEAPKENPVAEAPKENPLAEAPEEKPVAEVPKEKTAEGKAPDSPIAESAPQDGAAAESKPAESSEGRFTFDRVNDGYVRLDSRTGQVSFCSKRTVGWTCQIAPEDRGALENEITRLQEENTGLKKELLTRGGLPLPGAPAKAEAPKAQKGETIRLPTDPDLDRMKVLAVEMWHRLVELIATLQKDVLKKS